MPRRIDRGLSLTCSEAMERAHGHDHSCSTRRSETLAIRVRCTQRDGEVCDVVLGDLTDVRTTTGVAPRHVPREITSIRGDGIGRQPSLNGDVVEVAGNSIRDGGQASTSESSVFGMPKASATAP